MTRVAKTATWREALRQIIEGLKQVTEGEEVVVTLAPEVGEVWYFTWDLKEVLQRVFEYEYCPESLPTYDHNRAGFPVTAPYDTPFLAHPIAEFIWWGDKISATYKTARKFFQSREMKKLIQIWKEYYNKTK